MRIWILNHYASPPDRPAGTRHYEFGRVLAGQGHDITIFASSFGHFTRQEERLRPGERLRVQVIDGVRFVWIRTVPYLRNDYRRVLNMLSYALGAIRDQHRFQRPDVVVGSSVHLPAAAAAFLIATLRRVPFVFEVRDLWPRTLIDIGALRERGAAARLLTLLERFLYRHAAMIITLLPNAAQYIEEHGIPGEKISYVPNGVADYASSIQPASGDAAELVAWIKQQSSAGCLVAGYVGSHGRVNGVDVLVDAARELRDRGEERIAFAFVGSGVEKEWCQQIARTSRLANVLFWQPVPKNSVPAVLDALDVVLFSLRDVSVHKYGLSCNKLFDYLASGRPVVAGCAIMDNPVSASGGGICIPPESPSAVADALLQLAALNAAERHAVGSRGRKWVHENHGATALAGQFLAALARAQQ